MHNPSCPNCEWTNQPGASVCQRCGAPLGAYTVPPQQQPSPSYYYPPPPVPAKKGMGKGMIAMIVIGVILAVSVPVIGIVAAIAIPSLLAARRASNESAALGNLRTIGSAEATYLSENGKPGTFAELTAAQFLDSGWSDGCVRDSYRFRLVSIDAKNATFEFAAEPTSPSNGARSYTLTEDFIIRYQVGATAPKGKTGKEIGS
jgi:Tfp pilus assembly protein PilE